MTNDTLILEKHLKKTTIITNVFSMLVAGLTTLAVVNAFYYDTKNTLKLHTEEIIEVKKDVKDIKTHITDAQVFQGVSDVEVKSLKEKVNNIDVKLDKTNDKLDKILMQTK
jgi:septal ring factor EnvC (AmiA/AmiB activator)